MHVFVDKKKASDSGSISFPCPCVQCWSFCLFAPVENSISLKKKEKKQHTSPTLLLMLFVDVFREGFLKKEFEADPLSWFKREILYLFCTCIINWDVFNYYGCWNKACEVVYSVAEFSLSCFATVVKLKSDVRMLGKLVHLLKLHFTFSETPPPVRSCMFLCWKIRNQLFHNSCTEYISVEQQWKQGQ